MAYSDSLAARVRQLFQPQRGIVEKRMFGGLIFLRQGNMCVGIWKTSLIARLGPEQAAAALKEPHVEQFNVTGKPMKGWVLVEAEALESDAQLSNWIEKALAFVRTLPAK